jgi:hypothetical protein
MRQRWKADIQEALTESSKKGELLTLIKSSSKLSGKLE